jgi:hypothetical protein
MKNQYKGFLVWFVLFFSMLVLSVVVSWNLIGVGQAWLARFLFVTIPGLYFVFMFLASGLWLKKYFYKNSDGLLEIHDDAPRYVSFLMNVMWMTFSPILGYVFSYMARSSWVGG